MNMKPKCVTPKQSLQDYNIPVLYTIQAQTQAEAEQLMDGFMRFTTRSYGDRFNIVDWDITGETEHV